MSAPEVFQRRILAMAVGLTPQVVTETLYALAVVRDPPWIPTEIRLLTTAEGALRARLTLLDDDSGQFQRLCHEYGLTGLIQFREQDITVIHLNGSALQDIRTPEENAAAADAITDFVRTLCSDPEAAVHVSIAGGRKTLGYYMGYALSLFGREQDQLSHVLVNEPFEGLPEFFFPPKRPRVLFVGPSNRPASTADARVELAEIPFVRLRTGLAPSLLQGKTSFVQTVQAATRLLSPPRLRFVPAKRCVELGSEQLHLPPLLYAWYRLLARARKVSMGQGGWVRASDLSSDALLAEYSAVCGNDSAAVARLRRVLTRDGGIEESFFREKNAKVNRLLEWELGTGAAPYLIRSSGRRPLTRCGLNLAPANIELSDD